MDDVDREQLLRRSIEGDSDALGTLLEHVARGFRQRLRTRIPRRFQSALDEYDVMQVTYMEAFRHIQAFRGRDMPTFERWLYRIAYHNLQDALRSLDGATRPPRRQLALSADQDSRRVAHTDYRAPDPAADKTLILVLHAFVHIPDSKPKTPTRPLTSQTSTARISHCRALRPGRSLTTE